MPATHTEWTVEMLDALPDDGQRYEIIDGELFVTPAPSDVHQLVGGAFFRRLHDYLRAANFGRAMISPADVRSADRRRNRVQPDVFAVRLVEGKRPAYPYDLDDVLLIIEVESPSNPQLDYQIKRKLHLSRGVPEYWIVNASAQIVSRWRTVEDPGEVFDRRIEWHPRGMDKPLVIDLPALFDDALDSVRDPFRIGDAMLNDDETLGRILTRREALAMLGASGLLLLGGRGTRAQEPVVKPARGVCVVRPEQTEGPYFVDEKLHRSDIRTDPTTGAVSAGAPLALAFSVGRVVNGRCAPLPGAHVDVWQCDHLGVYSDVRDPRFDTRGRKFLRGYQVTDANGEARFTTVYPGWYQGRAVHIHFKIRSAPDSRPGFDFTSQLYFDDALTDRVHALEPYAAKGQRNVRNERDGIFRRQGGGSLMLEVRPQGDGYEGTFDLAIT